MNFQGFFFDMESIVTTFTTYSYGINCELKISETFKAFDYDDFCVM